MTDIESDLSAIHHIHEPETLPAQRFIDLAVRLMYYRGVLRGIAEYEAQQEEEGTPVPHISQAPSTDDSEKRVSDSAMLLHLAGDVDYVKADA